MLVKWQRGTARTGGQDNLLLKEGRSCGDAKHTPARISRTATAVARSNTTKLWEINAYLEFALLLNGMCESIEVELQKHQKDGKVESTSIWYGDQLEVILRGAIESNN